MLYLLTPELIDQLTAIADWSERSLAQYLADRPLARGADEDPGSWHDRCVEAWTASGARAIAEEETADAAALIAAEVVDAAVTPVIFIEQSGGVIQDIRLDPHESIVVRFDWQEITDTDLVEARSHLADLIEAARQLPETAQALMTHTIATATAVIKQREGASR